MNKKIKNLALIAVILTNIFLITSPILAQDQTLGTEAAQELTNQDQAFLSSSGLQPRSIGRIVSYIIKMLLALLGVIFIVLTIYAGLLWMTSAGNDEKIGQAKKIIIAATIGLALVLSAYAITVFVLDQLVSNFGITTGSQPNVEI
ncbi:MAG: hypothetical protein WCW26_00400 [Candidatus Buchananbacteria bacterium]